MKSIDEKRQLRIVHEISFDVVNMIWYIYIYIYIYICHASIARRTPMSAPGAEGVAALHGPPEGAGGVESSTATGWRLGLTRSAVHNEIQ
jgi:hypothetical protein